MPVKALETGGSFARGWGGMLQADSHSSYLFAWSELSSVIYTTCHLRTSQKCPAEDGMVQAEHRTTAGPAQPLTVSSSPRLA